MIAKILTLVLHSHSPLTTPQLLNAYRAYIPRMILVNGTLLFYENQIHLDP